MKQTFMQFFEWYLPSDHSLWKKVSDEAEKLALNGFTSLWLPPAYKGQAGKEDVGYGVYDMYDLGEFLSKGSVETKYGTIDEYRQCVKDLQSQKIGVLGDIVFNHRMGADEAENIKATNVNPSNRLENTGELYDVKVWTKYTFPERHQKYSDFVWTWHHFTGTDYNENNQQNDLMIFEGKEWSEHVSKEQGNFDFIMGDDVDFSVPEVVDELYRWGIWYTEISGVNGFRLDAIKSIDARFFTGWLKKMAEYGNHPDFAVGEYWTSDTQELIQYLRDSGHCMKLFDVPLHYRLCKISEDPRNADIRNVFEGTLSDIEPEFSAPFSDNHDTQPSQALESWVQEWFKPLSYALLLLRDCHYPFVFYGDYYGIERDQIAPVPLLKEMVWIRKNLLGDGIVDFNDDDPKKACWLVCSDNPVIVIMSIDDEWKQSEVCDLSLANRTFVDLNTPDHTVTADETGKAQFNCLSKSCTVYITQEDYQTLQNEMSRLNG
ncbi:alpha-amylase [Ileibacterium valens]|uniref:alpha-amylase n=2 Tax=Ileibacterium valens TaxID=1862668 RepID=UPI0024BB4425|nr:alpha-amylase [Ileibacterium valens]